MIKAKLIAMLTAGALTALGTACSRDKSQPVQESVQNPMSGTVKKTKEEMKVEADRQIEIATTLKTMFGTKKYPESDCSKSEMEKLRFENNPVNPGQQSEDLVARFERSKTDQQLKLNIGHIVKSLDKSKNPFCKVNIISEVAEITFNKYLKVSDYDSNSNSDQVTKERYEKAGIVVDGLSEIFHSSNQLASSLDSDRKPFVEHKKFIEKIQQHFASLEYQGEQFANLYNCDDNQPVCSLTSTKAANHKFTSIEYIKETTEDLKDLQLTGSDENEDVSIKTEILREISTKGETLVEVGNILIKQLKTDKENRNKVKREEVKISEGVVLSDRENI